MKDNLNILKLSNQQWSVFNSEIDLKRDDD